MEYGFIKKWFGPKPCPIGIDLGSGRLKLAQVAIRDGQPRLLAAASGEVPADLRRDAGGRVDFFRQTIKELLSQADFRGREVVLALPASCMFTRRLRLPLMDPEATRQALRWEVRGELPMDPSQAMIRHLVVGEVYQEGEPRQEVIVMAARQQLINQLLEAASRAQLNVIGMNVEPLAALDCFSQMPGFKTADKTQAFVDLGCSGTRVYIVRKGRMLFARAIDVGGEHLKREAETRARPGQPELAASASDRRHGHEGAAADNGTITEDREPAWHPLALRGSGKPTAERTSHSREAASGGTAVAEAPPRPQAPGRQTWNATAEARGGGDAAGPVSAPKPRRAALSGLVEELGLCRRYFEATFPGSHVERLVFFGGEAADRALCQELAAGAGMPAVVADPVARLGRQSTSAPGGVGEGGAPQSGWAVALGLSLGSSPADATWN